jgi:pyruvate/2-oxoglutarate dehydrogenase complex dihydrolipoamide dehydrogenase (E3) component
MSADRLAAQGIRVVSGEAKFRDRKTVVVGETAIRARHFILAVGALPAIPSIPGLEAVEYMTFADAFDLSRKPAYLIVLGAGRHALEMAQACNRLGIDTAIVSEKPALSDEDPELAAIVVDRLRAEGIRVRTGVRVRSVARRKGGVRILLEEPDVGPERALGEATVDGSHLFVAAGRTPAVAGLDLEAAGVAYDRDGIIVDSHLRTSNRDVYAIGDAVAGPPLATRAEGEAARLVRALRSRRTYAAPASAACAVAFTDPALASVGLSESEARTKHGQVRVLRFPFAENDRAVIERLPAGMIKVVTTGSGRVLGAAIVGRDAAELIAVWALAVAERLPVSAMGEFVAAYPSRAAIANSVAALPEARLTPSWRERIIALFRAFG